MGAKTTLLIVLIVLVLLVGVVIVIYANPLQVVNRDNEIRRLSGELNESKREITRLNTVIRNMTVTEVDIQTSLRVISGGAVEFTKLNDKLVMPNTLRLPKSSEDVSNSNMMVGSRFRFVPSNNWVARMRGSLLELNHPAKIWGSIKAAAVRDRLAEATLQSLLRDFFVGFPATVINYRRVFMEDALAGMVASAPITVDGKAHVLIVGIIQRGEQAVMLLFTYEEDNSGVQRELVDSLIRSGLHGHSRIILN